MTWTGKKVLVTGADGFIGSHLVEALCKRGANVRALSLYNSFNHWGWLEDISCLKDVEVMLGDVRDFQSCLQMTKDREIIFHLAALIAIPYSYTAPRSYIETNINGTLNICQAALNAGCSKLIQTSSSEVYGTAQYVPIDEKHPLQPQSPYSASKIGADAIASSFYSSFGLPLVIARPFNTYGPRQSARAVIPSIIAQISAGKSQIAIGDTRPTRDFNFVFDTCEGLIRLAETENCNGETFNLGSNFEISIEEIFEIIKSLIGKNVELAKDESRFRPQKSEVMRLWCDNSKLKLATSFSPKFDLRAGLGQTIDWFMKTENLSKYKANLYNV